MLTSRDLQAIRTIVVHDDCTDGLASAVLLHDALPDAEVRFVQYGTAAHRELVATRGMLFCDFSPPAERVAEFVAARAIVLDHHRSARGLVAAFAERGVFGDEDSEPGVSGAVLAYRCVWRVLRSQSTHRDFAERLATLAGIRDTWQKDSPLWRAACVQHFALSFLPQDSWMQMSLDHIERQWEERFDWVGLRLHDRQEDLVRRTLAKAWRFRSPHGARVIVFDGLGLASDAAEAAREEADVVVAFALEVESDRPTLRLSLRSNGALDVSSVARQFGGGGHTKAAGFSVPLDATTPHPFRLIEGLLAGI
jgi:oligoribonuclease NrnB/cAMP/cGMP phosphodiesterase (DHH superfamily)